MDTDHSGRRRFPSAGDGISAGSRRSSARKTKPRPSVGGDCTTAGASSPKLFERASASSPALDALRADVVLPAARVHSVDLASSSACSSRDWWTRPSPRGDSARAKRWGHFRLLWVVAGSRTPPYLAHLDHPARLAHLPPRQPRWRWRWGTSRTSRPPRAGPTWPSCSTCTRAVSSAGRSGSPWLSDQRQILAENRATRR